MTNPKPADIFYGWWIVAAAFLNLFFAVGIIFYGFPVLYPSLVDSLGFTRAQLTQGFFLGFVFAGIPFGLPAGAVIDRIGARWVILLGVGLVGRLRSGPVQEENIMALSYALLGVSLSLLVISHTTSAALAFALISGFSMGADYMLIPLVTAECFGTASLGKLLALIIMGYSLGQWGAPA
jgi:MFS family permease